MNSEQPASVPGNGRSFPIGARLLDGGVNFSVFSRSAVKIELLLFDCVDDTRPSHVIDMDPSQNRTYHYWHVFVPGLKAGQIYGFSSIRTAWPWQSQKATAVRPHV
jgi:glycogen operon protein